MLVDEKILQITDRMKQFLGLPLDGYRDAVSDVIVVRSRVISVCVCVISS